MSVHSLPAAGRLGSPEAQGELHTQPGKWARLMEKTNPPRTADPLQWLACYFCVDLMGALDKCRIGPEPKTHNSRMSNFNTGRSCLQSVSTVVPVITTATVPKMFIDRIVCSSSSCVNSNHDICPTTWLLLINLWSESICCPEGQQRPTFSQFGALVGPIGVQ